MVCYLVPTAAAIVHSILRKSIPDWRSSVRHLWLSLLLVGGAIFGVVDHLWNGELFLIGEKPLLDIALGLVITVVIFVAWGILAALDRAKLRRPSEHVS